MLNRMRKFTEEREQGFTLIELLVVIIIIGILAAIAIPVFLNQRKKGVDASLKSDLKNTASAEETWVTDNPSAQGVAWDGTVATPAALPTGLDVKPSTGNKIKIVLNATAGGYCITGYNANASSNFDNSAAGKVMVYDSTKGGLQPAGGTCAG